MIDGYIKFANSSDEAYVHIEAEVRLRRAGCRLRAGGPLRFLLLLICCVQD